MKIRLIFLSVILSFSFFVSCSNEVVNKSKAYNFKDIIESKTTLYELYDFLKSTDLKYVENIEDYHHTIKFDSFSVVYDKYGLKINE